MPSLKLGLIGDNIGPSRAPLLHRLAGRQAGMDVTYDLLVPATEGLSFPDLFQRCQDSGYRGLNVTLPYKETATRLVRIDDPLTKALGAINTVLFEPNGRVGHNTDHTGFVAAYQAKFGAAAPGVVCQIGAGGVGKAVAFGLAALDVAALRLVETDVDKAEALADALRQARPGLQVSVGSNAAEAAQGADGLINCTPLGMTGYGGAPLPAVAMAGARWAFDAVYTPVETTFLADAAANGLETLSGYELFFFQGVDAWRRFSGLELDQARLRRDLADAA